MAAFDCIGFGVSKLSGKLVDVEAVLRGKVCDCTCPACGGDLISRQGSKRAWHFAHESGSLDCVGAAESALHRAAKELIATWQTINLPSLFVSETIQGDLRTMTEGATIPSRDFLVHLGIAEVDLKSFRPDVLLHSASHESVAIEVFVSHAVDEIKGERVKAAGQPMVEFDLSKLPRFGLTTAQLDYALRQMSPKWIFHPGEDDAREQLRQKLYQQKASDFAASKRRRTGRGSPLGGYEPPMKTPRLLATILFGEVELRFKTHPLLEAVTVWACYATPLLRHQALMRIADVARSSDLSCTSSTAKIGYVNVWGAKAIDWALRYSSAIEACEPALQSDHAGSV